MANPRENGDSPPTSSDPLSGDRNIARPEFAISGEEGGGDMYFPTHRETGAASGRDGWEHRMDLDTLRRVRWTEDTIGVPLPGGVQGCYEEGEVTMLPMTLAETLRRRGLLVLED